MVRLVRTWPKKLSWIQGAAACLLAAVSFIFFCFPLGLGIWAIAPALMAGAFYYWLSMRRYLQRRRRAREPFPEAWREKLSQCVAFYGKLDEAGRERFETDVRIFMTEQRIYGVAGADAPEDVKLLVAASAAMLGFGMPDWEWPVMRDVVIYPTPFNEDYEADGAEEIAGMVHQQGPILLSGPDMRHSFRTSTDGYNLGLHELAHVLDMADGSADGIPAGVEWVATAPWVQIVADRLGKIRRGELRRVLRDYAGKNEAELFAVVVEVFFERPKSLAKKDPELFELLSDYFNVDPRSGKLIKE